MGGKEQEFWILEVTGDQFRFVKVAAESVDIGEGIEAFAYNESAPGAPLEFWRIADLMTGRKLCKPYALKEEAIGVVARGVEEAGLERYKAARDRNTLVFGRSPACLLEFPAEPEIEVNDE